MGLFRLLPFVALAVLAAPASAGGPYDFCVTCTAPTMTYLCTVGAREPDPGAAAWGQYCAERVRHDAGHSSCTVRVLAGKCDARRAFVFRGARATPDQAAALVSGEPERRSSAAAAIWKATVTGIREVGDTVGEGAGAVGRAVGEGAEVVGEEASDVGEGFMEGLGAVGRGVARGAECVWSLGERC